MNNIKLILVSVCVSQIMSATVVYDYNQQGRDWTGMCATGVE